MVEPAELQRYVMNHFLAFFSWENDTHFQILSYP
jgi:hypothetical protein